MAWVALLLAFTMVAAACSSAGGGETQTGAPESTTDEPVASDDVDLALDPDAPIAVRQVDPDLPGNEGLLVGTLEIEGRCVYIQPNAAQQQRVFVLFGSPWTSWDDQASTLLGDNGTGNLMAFADGDRIEIGGGGVSPSLLDNFTWVVPPDPSCDMSKLWAGTTIGS